MTSLTDREADAIAHALGVPIKQGARRSRRWSIRNHFAAEGEDLTLWRGLVARGLAVELCSHPKLTTLVLFRVTRAGVEAAGLTAYIRAGRIKT